MTHPLDDRKMYERVLGAVLRLNESVTFGRVEPLHCSLSHVPFLRNEQAHRHQPAPMSNFNTTSLGTWLDRLPRAQYSERGRKEELPLG